MNRSRFQVVCDTPNALWAFDKKLLRRIMRQAGAEVSNAAKALMRASAGGRQYHGGRKGKYNASAAGQAPAVRTRNLLRSIKVQPYRNGLGVAVRATEFYGLFLEAGAQGGESWGGANPAAGKTRRGKRNTYDKAGVRTGLVGKRVVAPRPFLSAAMAQRQSSLGSRIAAAVQDGITFQKKK